MDEYGNRGHKFPGLCPRGSVGSQGLPSTAVPMKLRHKKEQIAKCFLLSFIMA